MNIFQMFAIQLQICDEYKSIGFNLNSILMHKKYDFGVEFKV